MTATTQTADNVSALDRLVADKRFRSLVAKQAPTHELRAEFGGRYSPGIITQAVVKLREMKTDKKYEPLDDDFSDDFDDDYKGKKTMTATTHTSTEALTPEVLPAENTALVETKRKKEKPALTVAEGTTALTTPAMTKEQVEESLLSIEKIVEEAKEKIEKTVTLSRVAIGEHASKMKAGANWKAINEGREVAYRTWGDFCAGELGGDITKGNRMNVEDCINEYISARELPRAVAGQLKPIALRYLGKFEPEVRKDIVSRAMKLAPKSEYGPDVTEKQLKEMAAAHYPEIVKALDNEAQMNKRKKPEETATTDAFEDDGDKKPAPSGKFMLLDKPVKTQLLQWNNWAKQALETEDPAKIMSMLHTLHSDFESALKKLE